jgi:hypothetical protein
MRPYGVTHVGPVCAYGCCWMQTTQSGLNPRLGHGYHRPQKKRARREARAFIRAELARS